MDELNPIYRIEFFLDAIVNNTTPPEPIYRVEFYLAKIAGADVEIPEPVHRMEFYLAYLCGENVELPTPVYRMEFYLASLCGMQVELPEPIYRIEFWLWDWCGGGGIEKTITGNPIHITDALAKPVQALSIALEPIQDLHGYDSPWPAGGGRNRLPCLTAVTTGSGLTFTPILRDGVPIGIHVSGTANASYAKNITSFHLDVGNYTNQVFTTATEKVEARVYSDSSFGGIKSTTKDKQTFNIATADTYYFAIGFSQGVVYDGDFYFMIDLTSGHEDVFYPYENLCPISGHTDADVIVSPTLNPSVGTTYPIPLGQTVYGCVVDVVTGKVWANKRYDVLLNSNNWRTWGVNNMTEGVTGFFQYLNLVYPTDWENVRLATECDTLPINSNIWGGRNIGFYTNITSESQSQWYEMACFANSALGIQATDTNEQAIAKLNAYLADNPIGVVHALAEPILVATLTPTQVELLQGENNIWSDGEITLVYLADGNASDVEALNILLGGRYTNNHTADEPSDREALDILLCR